MKMIDRIQEVATRENAYAWAATSEQFTFCIDLLEISAHHPRADAWVERLETFFEVELEAADEEFANTYTFESRVISR